MFNIFIPARTGLGIKVDMEIMQIKNAIVLADIEQFDLDINSIPNGREQIKKSSIENILKNGEINTFKLSENAGIEFFWYGIENTFGDPLNFNNEGLDGDLNYNNITNVIIDIENLKNNCIKDLKKPLVTCIKDFYGIKELLFKTTSVNIILPYLAISDFDDGVEASFIKNILEKNGDNFLVFAEVPEALEKALKIKKVNFPFENLVKEEKASIIHFSKISETIDEMTQKFL